MEVICIKYDGDINENDFQIMRTALSEERKARVDRFKKRNDAVRTMLWEIIVRMHCQRKLNISFDDVYFLENEYRKPGIGNATNLHFNVSHSGQWIMIAFHNHEVGVDVERIKPIDFRIIDHFFSKEELYFFNQTREPDRLSHFYDLWVLKESYVKAIGKGFYEDFSDFSIIKEHEGYQCFKNNEKIDMKFTLMKLSDEYKFALCARHYVDYSLTVSPIQKVINDYKAIKRYVE